MEDIPSLEPGQTAKRTLLAHFHHHLLPLKLALFCNARKFPVKFRPDIGYFVKPLSIGIEAFRVKESRLLGMFDHVRRYDIVISVLLDTNRETNPPEFRAVLIQRLRLYNLMAKSGRRPLIMASASGTFLGCFITGIAFFLKASFQ
ncbi:AP3-complex subunit beta-A [Sesbania bispinosa]|nr:AP3-complex subunit beta-A [Sesbania bispinosa]